MDSLRQNTVFREIGTITEVEFPAPRETVPSAAEHATPSAVAYLQLLWERRRVLGKAAAWALAISAVVAFLIPNQYESTVSIMPPDSMNSTSAMLAAVAGRSSPELAAMAGSLLGIRGKGPLFTDLFRSRTVQDRVVDRLNLQKVYRSRYKEDARRRLNRQTTISEDRKSGVISLDVTDDRSGGCGETIQHVCEQELRARH